MSKHKAPWRVETNSMGRVVTVCSADGWPISRMVEDTDKDSAALIAAAPELLDAAELALRTAESWIHDQLDGTSSLESALAELEPVRAAIAKAGSAHG